MLFIYQVNHLTNMPICACNKVKMNVKPNTKNYNMLDDEQVAVSSSDSHALANVNSTPTFKTKQHRMKGEGVVQFMKQVPVLILQGMKVKVVTQDTSTPTITIKISLNWVDDLVGRVEDLGGDPVTEEKDDYVLLGEVKFVILNGYTDKDVMTNTRWRYLQACDRIGF